MNKNMVLSPEEAGAGFAVSVVFAEKFRGQEISSIQALKAADINFGADEAQITAPAKGDAGLYPRALELCRAVLHTLTEQSEGWKQRSLFERQWVIRDFKKTAGKPVEEWLEALKSLEKALETGAAITPLPLDKLARYYIHLAELAKGYEKNPAKLEENLRHVYGWKDEVDKLQEALE
jgi:hypothetical protein